MVLEVVLNRPSALGNDAAVRGSYGSWIMDRILVLPNKDLSSLIESVIKPLLESTLKSQKKEIIETFDKKVKTILDGQKKSSK